MWKYYPCSASADLETDDKIQHIVQTEFRDCTLLCITHAYTFRFVSARINVSLDRLRTIISYGRVLMMGAGSVAVSYCYALHTLVLQAYHVSTGVRHSL